MSENSLFYSSRREFSISKESQKPTPVVLGKHKYMGFLLYLSPYQQNVGDFLVNKRPLVKTKRLKSFDRSAVFF